MKTRNENGGIAILVGFGVVALSILIACICCGCSVPAKKGQVQVVQAPSLGGVIYPVAKAQGAADRIIINGGEIVKLGAPPDAPISKVVVRDAVQIRDNLSEAVSKSDKTQSDIEKLGKTNGELTNTNSTLAQDLGAATGQISILNGQIFLHWIGHGVAGVIIIILIFVIIRTGSITRLFG